MQRVIHGIARRLRRGVRLVGRRVDRLGRIRQKRRNARFQRLIAEGRHNRRVNQTCRPLSLEAVAGRVETGALELERDALERLLGAEALARFRGLGFAHAKPLEYLATLEALAPAEGEVLLDAAGGASAEYLRAARDYLPWPLELWSQDSLPAKDVPGIRFLGGSVDALPLDDGCVDAIACHHSFEHFRGDLDRRFLREALRVLRPGGRLAVVPLFLADVHAEFWNRRPTGPKDRGARRIFDRSAAFAGWGPFEGFARVYDPRAFEERVLAELHADCEVRLLAVHYEGGSAPDLATNPHQPAVNGEMKLLLVRKLAPT